jgi:beta-glucosidase
MLIAVLVAAALTVIAARAMRPRFPDARVPTDRDLPEWVDRHQSLVKAGRAGGFDVAVFGDSITAAWERHRDVWADRVTGRPTVFFGVNGDYTNHLLWRLDHGELDGPPPKLVVLLIGINNFREPADAGNVADAIRLIVHKLREKAPAAKVLVLGLLPQGYEPDGIGRQAVEAVNRRLGGLFDDETILFHDLGSALLEPDGSLSEATSDDGTHLTRAGYERWAAALGPVVRQLLGD